jgi:hypothetical protein
VDPEETDIARQWLGKHMPTARNMHTTNRRTVGNVFSILFMSKIYS